MDVRFSPEQQALRESVAQAVKRLGPHAVADLADRERASRLGAAVEAAGWRQLREPGPDGRPLASGVEVAIVAEELAYALADVAFLGPTMARELRRLAGAPSPASLETVALEADLSALARSPTIGQPAAAVAVDAAGSAHALFLPADPACAGVVRVPLGDGRQAIDLTRPGATAFGPMAGAENLGDAFLSRSPATIGRAPLDGWTALGLATACADLVGTMRGAIDLASEYAKARKQFGVPVGSFQAVQHLLADALVAMEGARSLALRAAWAVDALPSREALQAASIAKAYCARAARSVCETSIQVHGGVGHTWDCLAHLYVRRALLSADVLGGVGASLARVLEYETGACDGLR